MKKYSIFERKSADFLGNFPQLKQITKTIYQSLNYWYFSDRDFQLALHPQARILTPFEWCGVKEPKLSELFFGYYDKSPWSADMSKFICHRLKDKREIEIILCDRVAQTVTTIATSKTWSSQQGTMVQWLPNCSNEKIIFNDLVAGKLAARIVSLKAKTDTVPFPIQTLHPHGKEALTLNYKRLNLLRPEYGYEVEASNFSSDLPPAEDGIWHVDLESGEGKLIFSLQALAAHQPRPEMANAQHKVNHIMYSPQGSKFVFMHRWLSSQGKFSRLYVAGCDGSNLQLLLDENMVSHYSWDDERYLLAWARTKVAGDRYYYIDTNTGEWQIVGKEVLDIYGDGHPSFSPNRRWIITDTYPDRARQQHLLLYDRTTQQTIELGRFLAPLKYSAAQRCDLHPRWSPDGKMISIDATYQGKRYSYFIDIAAIVND